MRIRIASTIIASILGIVQCRLCMAMDPNVAKEPEKPDASATWLKQHKLYHKYGEVEYVRDPGQEKEYDWVGFVGLEDFLDQAGDDFDCYFTIERLNFPLGRLSALEAADVQLEDVTTVEELIQKLERALEKVKIVRVHEQPLIIRLVETDLLELKDYPLDQSISLDFSGRLSELLRQIQEKTGSVGPVTAGAYPPEVFPDAITKTELTVRDVPIRDALTEAIPLTGYSRRLWLAVTHKDYENPQRWHTSVSY